jgi:methionine synthase I (cobalamin-dependent)
MNKSFLDILKEKIVVFDGATGTHIQGQRTSEANASTAATNTSPSRNLRRSRTSTGIISTPAAT